MVEDDEDEDEKPIPKTASVGCGQKLIELNKVKCLFVWMDVFRKIESGYPIRDFASYLGTEQMFLLL